MQEHQSVPDDGDGKLPQEVVLHGDRLGETASVEGLAGGPGHGVGRAARHIGDLLVCGERKLRQKEE